MLAGPQVWEELTQAMASRQVVQGRMLNACSGGYAVGVAGLVAFVPFTQCSSQAAANIGALQPFYVARMDAMRRLVTLQSAAGSLGASQTSGGSARGSRRRRL